MKRFRTGVPFGLVVALLCLAACAGTPPPSQPTNPASAYADALDIAARSFGTLLDTARVTLSPAQKDQVRPIAQATESALKTAQAALILYAGSRSPDDRLALVLALAEVERSLADLTKRIGGAP